MIKTKQKQIKYCHTWRKPPWFFKPEPEVVFNRRRGDDGACEVGGGVLIRIGAKIENIYNEAWQIIHSNVTMR